MKSIPSAGLAGLLLALPLAVMAAPVPVDSEPPPVKLDTFEVIGTKPLNMA